MTLISPPTSVSPGHDASFMYTIPLTMNAQTTTKRKLKTTIHFVDLRRREKDFAQVIVIIVIGE
jgi:hypothetical protein